MILGTYKFDVHPAPTVPNHLIFEAGARVVRAEARKILRTPALLRRSTGPPASGC
jgi:hypothetical protein